MHEPVSYLSPQRNAFPDTVIQCHCLLYHHLYHYIVIQCDFSLSSSSFISPLISLHYYSVKPALGGAGPQSQDKSETLSKL